MKITRIGWVGKGETALLGTDTESTWREIVLYNVYASKDGKNSWNYEWWPPHKVRITVEDVE